MVIKLSSPATNQFWEIPIVFEDEHLLALDKPAGLPTVPDQNEPEKPSLVGLLHRGIHDSKPWALAHNLTFLAASHRLDPEAGGILLLAKSKPVLATLMDLFGSEQPSLSFLVVAEGASRADQFTIDAKLAPHPVRADKVHVDAKRGKRARTIFEVLERFHGWALIKATPLTHRHHQVRVHLGRAGFHLAGDALYGGKPLLLSSFKSGYYLKPKHTERPLLSEARLHAAQLSIAHPVTGEKLTMEAPPPKDLQVALKYLRKYAADQGNPD